MATPAHADVVIGLSENEAPITIEQVGGTNAFFSGAFGDFSNVSVTANGFGLLGLPDLLNSTGQEVHILPEQSATTTLVILITQTNVPAAGVVSFNSLFTNNLLPMAGLSTFKRGGTGRSGFWSSQPRWRGGFQDKWRLC